MLVYQTLNEKEALKLIGRYVNHMRHGECIGMYKLRAVYVDGTVQLYDRYQEDLFVVPLAEIANAVVIEEI